MPRSKRIERATPLMMADLGKALLDTNVILASVHDQHINHETSSRLFIDYPARHFAVAAHSLAEAYSQLTRLGVSAAFRWKPAAASDALEAVVAHVQLIGLTAAETFDAVRDYARGGGVGPRTYDRLIGEIAVRHAIPTIVSWNIRHMRSLFPELIVVPPPDYATPAN